MTASHHLIAHRNQRSLSAMSGDHELGSLSSADAVLRLLLLFREGHPIRVAEAADELGVARSTAHRMLTTLKNRGFVRQDRQTRSYLLGDVFVDFVRTTPRAKRLEYVARPLLEDLVKRTGETIHIGVLRGASVVFIAGVESPGPRCTGLHLAMTFPAHLTASGKCLLAALSTGELRKRYASEKLTAQRKNVVSSWSELLSSLEQTRQRGYATNLEESEAGVNAVAVPIRSDSDCPYGALALSGPSSRIGQRKMEGLARQLRLTARELSDTLRAIDEVPHGLETHYTPEFMGSKESSRALGS